MKARACQQLIEEGPGLVSNNHSNDNNNDNNWADETQELCEFGTTQYWHFSEKKLTQFFEYPLDFCRNSTLNLRRLPISVHKHRARTPSPTQATWTREYCYKCSDTSMEVELPVLYEGNYDRPTNQPTDRPSHREVTLPIQEIEDRK